MAATNLGDDCPACGGRIGVLNTRVSGEFRVRWLGCPECGFRPAHNKRVVPLSQAPPQRRRLQRRTLRRRGAAE